MLRDRGEGRLLAVGVVWFAVLGGGVHVYLLYLGLRIWWAYFIVLGFAGFCGMILSLVGASLVMMRWPDRIDSTLRVS